MISAKTSELIEQSLTPKKAQSFNYSVLKSDTRLVVEQRTSEIKTILRRNVLDLLEIGQRLIEVKEKLGHGHFLDWIEAEFEWDERTARRYMSVAVTFGFKSDIMSDLNLTPTTLYLLAAPSTPDSARTEALARAKAGEPITSTIAKTIVNHHRQTSKQKKAPKRVTVNALAETVEHESSAEPSAEIKPLKTKDTRLRHKLTDKPVELVEMEPTRYATASPTAKIVENDSARTDQDEQKLPVKESDPAQQPKLSQPLLAEPAKTFEPDSSVETAEDNTASADQAKEEILGKEVEPDWQEGDLSQDSQQNEGDVGFSECSARDQTVGADPASTDQTEEELLGKEETEPLFEVVSLGQDVQTDELHEVVSTEDELKQRAEHLGLHRSHNHSSPRDVDNCLFINIPEISRVLLRALPYFKNEQLDAVWQALTHRISEEPLGLHNWPNIAGSQTDITSRQRAEQQLLHDAFDDTLTDLPNRVLFMEQLEHAIKRAKRHENYLFAVLFLDVDCFKVVNNSLEHTLKEQLPRAIARRLEARLRPGDKVAHLGRDEFTILLENIKDVEDATQVADRIRKELTLPFNLSGHKVFTAASIGISLSTTGYDRPEDLLHDAELCCKNRRR